ncbi:MAG: hypothetical protein IAE80_30010 [Anaerolinea sp.]|nr:hypothetical protein [Anaerolinea sp.]
MSANVRRTLIFLIILLICAGSCGGILFKGVMDWDEEMRKPVTYTMPAAAQILDQYTSPSDFFGDFTYCASFRLPESELDNMISKGFDWVQSGSGVTSTSGLPKWQTGRFPREIPGSPCDNLKPWLDEVKTYRYLFAKGERNDWMRLLAIDEKEKIIFYFRGSW